MTERMLLEALIEKHGFDAIMKMIGQICDAKAAEMVAYGNIKEAKLWAAYANGIDQCE